MNKDVKIKNISLFVFFLMISSVFTVVQAQSQSIEMLYIARADSIVLKCGNDESVNIGVDTYIEQLDLVSCEAYVVSITSEEHLMSSLNKFKSKFVVLFGHGYPDGLSLNGDIISWESIGKKVTDPEWAYNLIVSVK